ncbi:SGNH/GDSL hydrolase family protein [Nocardioides dokdonensis]|uniref:SGNH/GDSL hydrolase family protein n=1 Tax=Nocardioides dokdonensis TaxID=450734 RepID=UPI00082D7B4E|nr:SGNH/GDSL hydrolase family protein [Nocardioides dokdonensis]
MLGPLVVSRRRTLGVALAALLLALAGVFVLVGPERATGSYAERCARFDVDSATRAGVVTGSGDPVLVVGDSWSAGLGLPDPAASWPSRLEGRVRVAGFSGSGFSAHASGCGAVSFADRVPAALVGLPAGALVVVAGGLNDWDRPEAEVRAGFTALVAALEGRRVVVVGPAAAPARAAYVPRVDALLAELSAAHGVAYLAPRDVAPAYLDDGLHLTPAGHATFGDWVADQLGRLPRPRA